MIPPLATERRLGLIHRSLEIAVMLLAQALPAMRPVTSQDHCKSVTEDITGLYLGL